MFATKNLAGHEAHIIILIQMPMQLKVSFSYFPHNFMCILLFFH